MCLIFLPKSPEEQKKWAPDQPQVPAYETASIVGSFDIHLFICLPAGQAGSSVLLFYFALPLPG
jgi:hypothetical protein